MQRKVWIAAMTAALSVVAGVAQAQQAGDVVLGAGWMYFSPQNSSKPLTRSTLGGPSTEIPNSGAKVSNASTVGLSGLYYFTSNWAVETVLGIPPSFKLDGTGSLAGVGRIGEAKQWSPTVLLRYTFLDGQAKFRPFVGLGATYVWYSDVRLTDNFHRQMAGAAAPVTNTSAKLSKSFAPVFNVGAGYQFDKHWGISWSVSYIPLKTKADLTTRMNSTGATVGTGSTKLTLDPIVSYLSLNYRF
ncbi:MAG: Outer membrane protein W [Paracidovorax wautersii]|uniref:Outer membrane protein W n=1 Tax=Paracidovorax wautersii TaxID=1177982 RepID=A0A7V8FN79_9BURK|nr:MAG: Outer membrane protein W [Paracidovorax wautersii]